MAYVNTPLFGQKVNNTQSPIRQNFVEIDQLIAVDHATFGDVNQGQHNKVSMPDQGIAPVFPANNLGLYAQLPTANPLTGVNELYVRKEDNTRVPITASGQAQTGWTYLPSGILMKWGVANTIAGQTTVVFPVAGNIPVFGAIYTVMTNPIGLLGLMSVVTSTIEVTTIDFEVTTYTEDGLPFASQVYYLAIGR